MSTTSTVAATPVVGPKNPPTSSVSSTVERVTATFSSFFKTIHLFQAEPMTPREFLTKFYTDRNMPEKLKDIDALVEYYGEGKRMPALYVELDKRYGTNFVANPPCGPEEVPVRPAELVAPPPSAPLTKTPVNKVILLGNSGVGKTNLLSRLAKGEFSSDFASTIGVEFLTHCMEIDGVTVKAQIWDTAGQERFHAMMSTYYRKAVGALLVFDVTDKSTFEGIQKWLDQLLQVAEPGLTIILVGNKADVDPTKRAVTTADAQNFAAAHHMMYVESSAKTGVNVDKAFRDLLTTVHRLQSYTMERHGDSLVDLNGKNGPAPDSFCG